jgi:hypothetical protein
MMATVGVETYVGYCENLIIILHLLVKCVNTNTKMHGEHKIKLMYHVIRITHNSSQK